MKASFGFYLRNLWIKQVCGLRSMKPIIEVENLSKLYHIGAKEAYGSLRDEIMQAITAPFRRLKPKIFNLTPNTDSPDTTWYKMFDRGWLFL